MIDSIYEKEFGSPHFVYLDRLEQALASSLAPRTPSIQKMGKDLLCEIDFAELNHFLTVLKDKPEFSIDSFKDIKLFWKSNKPYALIVLYSYENNFNLLIKSPLGDSGYRNCYFDFIEILTGHFPEAAFFRRHKPLDASQVNFSLYSQPAAGMDSFDIHLKLDEDRVSKAYIDSSIAHISQKGLLEDRNLLSVIARIGVLDYDAGIFPELCLCQGLEKILEIKVGNRVKAIRMIICELSRICSHLGYLGRVLEAVGYDIMGSQVAIQREKVLKLMETITGARLLPNFIRIGGVRKDITPGKLLMVKKALPELLHKIRALELSMLENILVFNRLQSKGIISREQAMQYGLTGPNLRAAGVRKDLRKDSGYLLYEGVSFTTPLGRQGDALERVTVRFKEIYQSLRIINHGINHIPEEEIKVVSRFNIAGLPFRSYLSSVECPHGMFHIYMETGHQNLDALAVMGPSINSLIAAEKILVGELVEDIPLIMASLDISGGEIMRNRWS